MYQNTQEKTLTKKWYLCKIIFYVYIQIYHWNDGLKVFKFWYYIFEGKKNSLIHVSKPQGCLIETWMCLNLKIWFVSMIPTLPKNQTKWNVMLFSSLHRLVFKFCVSNLMVQKIEVISKILIMIESISNKFNCNMFPTD